MKKTKRTSELAWMVQAQGEAVDGRDSLRRGKSGKWGVGHSFNTQNKSEPNCGKPRKVCQKAFYEKREKSCREAEPSGGGRINVGEQSGEGGHFNRLEKGSPRQL